MTKFTVIDLFSGAGGLSKGFLDAGYNVVLGIDSNDSALRSFECNHGDTKALKLDLFDINNVEYIVNEFSKQYQSCFDWGPTMSRIFTSRKTRSR